MRGKVFLDTNVLVYAYDTHDPEKQVRAQAVLIEALETETGTVSTQVLSEFFCVVTRRIPAPLSADEAQSVIHELGVLEIVEIDIPMIHRAIEVHKENRLIYWDALILAAAERGRCAQVFSEDLNAGQAYAGVKVVNPFVGGV